jgi:thiamine biosynthesis lipoprotein
LLALVGAGGLREFEAVEAHMGTLVRIQLYAADEGQARAAFQTAFARIRELDEELSDYRPESELNRVTREAVGRPVKVSRDLFRVLEASQQIAAESGGAFDVTIGPLTHLWRKGKVPESAAIREALARCGYQKMHLDATAGTVQFDRPDMQLDAGAIAKGFAADEALAVITRLGISRALVAASGDLAFSDAPPGREGWRIGVGGFGEVVTRRFGAASTSGADEQHVGRYSHIIDPRTGMGLESGIVVTVLARRGIEADAMSTAVSVLGRERGEKLVARHAGMSAKISVK